MTKRQKLIVGAVVQIDLGEEGRAYGRVVSKSELAFYDFLNTGVQAPVIENIVSSYVAFRIQVMNYAVKTGRWTVLGHLPLEPSLKDAPLYFIQDQLSSKLSLYLPDGSIRLAAREECEGVECAAVWDPEHVEDRLHDHFAGRPNKWVAQLRLK